MRGEDYVVEREQLIIRAAGLFIERVQGKAAETAGAQRGNERIALHDIRARDIDQAGARLHQRQPLRIDKVPGRRIVGKLRNDPVATGEQRVQRLIGNTQRLFFAPRQARALEIPDVHSERRCAQGDFAANLTKPYDPECTAV